MSTTSALIVIIVSVPAGVVAVILIAFVTYRIVANDIARRLRDDALQLPGGPLDPRTDGIRYAADKIERWGRR